MGQQKGNPTPSYQNQAYETLRPNTGARENRDMGTKPVMIDDNTTLNEVVDITFENETVLPTIYDALEVRKSDGVRVVLEVQAHIGENAVRAVSMDSTDGFTRGMEVVSTGGAIKMPTGEGIKGRLFNVVGDAIDGIGAVDNKNGLSIHREAPKFEDLSSRIELMKSLVNSSDET